MKNLICVLFIGLLISGCGNSNSNESEKPEASSDSVRQDTGTTVSQAQKNSCIYCDKKEHHVTDAFTAGRFIKKFQTTFKNLKYYGGTIYFPPGRDNVTLITPLDMFNYDIWRFHYCSVENNVARDPNLSMEVYLAFEKGYCTDDELTQHGVLGSCIKSTKVNYLEKFSDEELNLDDYHFRDKLQDSKIKFLQECGFGDKQQIQDANDSLKTSGLFADYIKCPEFEGNFVLNNSLADINKDPDYRALRYYFGLDDNATTNKIRVILIGVDSTGQNLKIWRETSMPHD